MAKLDVFDVVGNGVEALRLRHHLLARHKYELGVLIDKLPDEPGTCDAIDLDLLASDPFHLASPLILRWRPSGVREDKDTAMCCRNYIKLIRCYQRRCMRARAGHGSRVTSVARIDGFDEPRLTDGDMNQTGRRIEKRDVRRAS